MHRAQVDSLGFENFDALRSYEGPVTIFEEEVLKWFDMKGAKHVDHDESKYTEEDVKT